MICGSTPFMFACAQGRSEMARELMARGTSIHLHADDGWTALHAAALGGKHDLVCELLGRGLFVDPADLKGVTPMMVASQNGHVRIVRELLDRGVKVNARTNLGDTALINASYKWFHEVVQELVNRGAVQTPNFLGTTPIFFAKQATSKEILKILEAGPQPLNPEKDNNNNSSSSSSSRSGNTSSKDHDRPSRLCNVCKQPAKWACGGCKTVRYCSREHQAADWKPHKLVCNPRKV